MRKSGITRQTRQRKVVYEVVKHSKSHPTADMIFEQVRHTLPTISLGTVYRNLGVLRDQGMVSELRGSDRRAHFEADLEPHAHFSCSRCGSIEDVRDCPAPEWQDHPSLADYDIQEFRLSFIGICPVCNRASSA